MPNDITASAILAQKAIASLTEQFPIVGLFSTNYGTELTALGQSVNVPVFGATGAVKKTGKGASIDYASEADGNIGSVTVQMGTLIYASHALDLYDVENLSDDAKAQIIVEGAKAVHRKIDAELATLAFTAANNTALTCAGKDTFTLADITAARGQAAAMKLNMDTLVMVLTPKAYNDLLSDANVTKSLTTLSENALVSGRLAEIVGVKICVSSAIPEGYFGYLAEKSSIAIAARPTTALGATWNTVLTAEGGLAMTSKGVADGVHSRELYVVETAFGCAAVKASASEKRIVALKCAAGE